MKIKFRNYLFGTLIIFSILLIVILSILTFFVSEDVIKNEKLRDYETSANTITYYLDRFIEEKRKDIDLIFSYTKSTENFAINRKEAEKLLLIKPEIKYVLILDKKGIVIDSIPNLEDIIGLDLSKTEVYRNRFNVKFYGPYISIIDKKPYYILSKSIGNREIIALINIPGINSLIETLKSLGYYAFIVDTKGQALAHVNEEIVQEGMNLSGYEFIKEGINGKEGLLEGDIEGEKFIFLARKIPKTNYILFIGNKYSQALVGFRAFSERLIFIFLLLIVMAFLISLIISKKFTNPISKIISFIETLKAGQYKVSKINSDIEELEEISKALYNMSQTLADREIKLKKIFEASKDAIAISTLDGELLDFNEAAVKMFGYQNTEEIVQNLRVDSIYYNDLSDRDFILRELKEKGSVENYEVLFKKKDGSLFYGLISSSLVRDEEGKPLFIVSTIKDITEKRKLQEQLFQAQKMESIGRLAGSIAHDFNNILSIIHGSNQLIQMHIKNDPQIERYTSNITQGVEKARDFIRKLLSFSKRQPLMTKIYDLNEILKEEVKLLTPTLREDISVELKTTDFPLLVNIDRTQFTQILLNLAINSIDAMPSGGKITISTEEKVFEYEHTKKHPFVREGRFACLVFSDTGIGIPDEIKDKIFEPFFTTKPEGTGLGLATVYSIVQQHNGFINVYSEKNGGATFKIYLPLIKSSKDFSKEKEETVETGIKNILLVEDNKEVRGVIEEILRNNGYEVYSFSDGIEVISHFDKIKDKIEICLFDVVMPKIGGIELYEKLRKMKPDIKVIFMTGYANNILQIQNLIKEGQQIINKPFGIAELKKKIKEVLG
ncbi:ATP-binding protein [Thermodesulfovibrio sp.]|uniref:hybrid sensor histidine kinase/response regulator n=1 Tax=Thermodesulfovibrio sp. TaxID=2067987 RepID=UPI00309C4F4F